MENKINNQIKKVALCGSMVFAREMLMLKEKLESIGLRVYIQDDVGDFITGKRTNENKWRKISLDPFKTYFEVIKNSDAVLVVNLDKNKIKNYVGANTLIEMAFAHVLGKKIFFLNPLPEDVSYIDEIAAMRPIILHAQIGRIME